MIMPDKSYKPNCFAFGNQSKSGCKALKVLDCKGCKFFKSREELRYQELLCEKRLNLLTNVKIAKLKEIVEGGGKNGS